MKRTMISSDLLCGDKSFPWYPINLLITKQGQYHIQIKVISPGPIARLSVQNLPNFPVEITHFKFDLTYLEVRHIQTTSTNRIWNGLNKILLDKNRSIWNTNNLSFGLKPKVKLKILKCELNFLITKFAFKTCVGQLKVSIKIFNMIVVKFLIQTNKFQQDMIFKRLTKIQL